LILCINSVKNIEEPTFFLEMLYILLEIFTSVIMTKNITNIKEFQNNDTICSQIINALNIKVVPLTKIPLDQVTFHYLGPFSCSKKKKHLIWFLNSGNNRKFNQWGCFQTILF